MEDRKLYHLVNGEFVLNGMPSVHIPTYAEIGAHIAILNDVGFFDDHSVAEPVCFDGISNGKRNTEKQASLYDAMLAEIYAERNRAKARRVRKVDNRTRAERLADWEQEKDRRKDIHLDWVERDSRRKFGHGKTHYWDSNAERNICNAEAVAREDWEIELRNIADDAERDAIEAEIREWELKHAVEQANARAWMAMQDWLEWA